MLFNTNLRAKQSYDWLVTGLSPSAVRGARAQAADWQDSKPWEDAHPQSTRSSTATTNQPRHACRDKSKNGYIRGNSKYMPKLDCGKDGNAS